MSKEYQRQQANRSLLVEMKMQLLNKLMGHAPCSRDILEYFLENRTSLMVSLLSRALVVHDPGSDLVAFLKGLSPYRYGIPIVTVFDYVDTWFVQSPSIIWISILYSKIVNKIPKVLAGRNTTFLDMFYVVCDTRRLSRLWKYVLMAIVELVEKFDISFIGSHHKVPGNIW